jgi:hypothetical protein
MLEGVDHFGLAVTHDATSFGDFRLTAWLRTHEDALASATT